MDKLEVDQADQKSEDSDTDITPLRYDVMTYPADYTLEVLYQKWNNNDLVIPKFQRNFVWDVPRASRLIESIMMGLPIPPVFFYVRDDNKYLVIDGMQRLTSIFSFMRGFLDETHKLPFAMKGINPQNPLCGKTFEGFSDAEQRELKNYVLRAIIIKQLRPDNNTSIYHIFQRLNTGGMVLSDQEVRNCIYDGSLNDMLVRLNKYDKWRRILGKEKSDNRKRDIGYALRCISLLHNYKKYKKPMRDFLSQFMQERRNPTPEYIAKEEHLFRQTCDTIVEKLGERPFHPNRSLSPSMLDSVFVAFARHPDSCPADIQSRFSQLLCDPNYIMTISSSTTDPSMVEGRMVLADKMLFGE